VGVALGDELVALGEPLVGAFGGLPERDEVVEGGLGLRERAVVFPAVVLLPDLHEEPRVAFSVNDSCGSEAMNPDRDSACG
jgi:hypothetical protein